MKKWIFFACIGAGVAYAVLGPNPHQYGLVINLIAGVLTGATFGAILAALASIVQKIRITNPGPSAIASGRILHGVGIAVALFFLCEAGWMVSQGAPANLVWIFSGIAVACWGFFRGFQYLLGK